MLTSISLLSIRIAGVNDIDESCQSCDWDAPFGFVVHWPKISKNAIYANAESALIVKFLSAKFDELFVGITFTSNIGFKAVFLCPPVIRHIHNTP